MTIKVGDTVTIRDEEHLGEYTVLTIHPDESGGWRGGFAWLHGPENYKTRAVAVLKHKTEYIVEFYASEYYYKMDDPYFTKRLDNREELSDYIDDADIDDAEIVVIRKE